MAVTGSCLNFDGTLTDPRLGIIRCLQRAMVVLRGAGGLHGAVGVTAGSRSSDFSHLRNAWAAAVSFRSEG